MASKMGPDFLIKRRVKINEKYAESDAYARKLTLINGTTGWFEGKMKYDFQDDAKRNDVAIKQEIKEANLELKRTRHHRLSLLYENEARTWEAELRERGLAVVRQHY